MRNSRLGMQAVLSVMAASSAIGGVDIPEPKIVKRKPAKTYNKSKEQQRRLKQMSKRRVM